MKIQKRRKRENKTDYGKRIKLLKSGKPRVVFRKSNKYVLAQYVTSKEAQDKIKMSVNSKHLIKYGWPENAKGSLKSITASYFIGLLIGKQIISKSLEVPIVDLGMNRTNYGTKVYAFLKGLIDAGVEIKCKEDAFPSEERIEGKHMENKVNFTEIKSKIEQAK